MNGKIQVNSGDISIIAVNVDGKSVDVIPSKGEGKYFESAECTNGAQVSWDRTNWRILLNTTQKTKCTLNFATIGDVENQSVANKMEELFEKDKNNTYSPAVINDEYNNIRYIGPNSNNYIYFSCKGETQDDQNCEKWRIIGLMDGIKTSSGKTERLLKIIREKLPVNLSWDSSKYAVNNGTGVNEWSQADIQKVLNNDYFYAMDKGNKCYNNNKDVETECPDWTQVGLSSLARDMIEEVVWNTGTSYTISWTWQNYTPLEYSWERSENIGKLCDQSDSDCTDEVQRTTEFIGKVGLMYPSDYGYATDGSRDHMRRVKCLYMPLYQWYKYGSSDNSVCENNDWLYDRENSQWTMTPVPNSFRACYIAYVTKDGNVAEGYAYNVHAVRPVVYLKSSVKITGGDGSSGNPFTLSIE